MNIEEIREILKDIKWSTWVVPFELIKPYIILLLCVLFVFPLIIGLRFSLLGYAMNYFWFDYMFFMWYKAKVVKQIEWERRQKRKEFRDD
jgi:hypothetical protein